MAVTFKDLKLPGGSVVDGSVVLYKAWLEDKNEANKPKRGKETAMYELNTDKDRFALSEAAAVKMAVESYEDLMKIISPNTDPQTELDEFVYGDMDRKLKLLQSLVLTIATIYLHPEAYDESVIALPDPDKDPTPEEVDPYYDVAAGTLYATIGGRMKDIKMSHNTILDLHIDYTGQAPVVTKIDIEPIPLN